MKKYRYLTIVFVVVFSLLIVGIFSAFGYLLYQKIEEDRIQNEIKKNLDICVEDSEQEIFDELSDNDADEKNISQSEESDAQLQVTPKPQKTEKPEKQQQDSERRSKLKIQEQFLNQFLKEQVDSLQVTDYEGKIIIYNRFYPGISVEFTYDEAEKYLDASKSDQQKIKNRTENMSKVNHLWLTYDIYLEYYNTVKRVLPQNTEFQFYFEVLNPWTSANVEYSETEFWGVLTPEKPIYVNVMILFDQSQGNENHSEVSKAVYEKVKEKFAGNALRLEVSSASVDDVKNIEAYKIKYLFLDDSKSLHNVCTNVWNLDDKIEEVNFPGSGASIETEYFYDSEMEQIRNQALSVYADLGLDLSAADYDGKVFMLYSKLNPGISVELSYSNSDNLQSPKADAVNHLIIKEEIYDKLISCVNKYANGTDFKLNSHFNLPGGNLLYAKDKEAFLGAFSFVPFYYSVYIVLDEQAENIDLDNLNEEMAKVVSDFYGDISMRITVNSVVSTQFNQIETYMLQKMFAYKQDQLGGEVNEYFLEK